MFRNTRFRSVESHYRSARKQEEIDHAIALSLVEDINRTSDRLFKRGGWFEDDFFLAGDRRRTLGNMPSYSHYLPSYPPSTPGPCHSTAHRICGGCKRNIEYGNYLGCMGTFYHPACFRCRACGYQITGNEYTLSGKDAYHKSCFRPQTYPKCEVCHQCIPKNAAGLIEYRCHPFWSQKYCPAHESDNTARCCSCERLEPRNAEYAALTDGRRLCLECLETAIMDTGECQPLYHSIRDFYEGMNMRLDQQIPLLLVERQALNEAIVGEKHGNHQMAETRGLCLSEEQTVTSIMSRPMTTIGNSRSIGMMRTQPQKLTRVCEVTAILVLYGLPRLLTGSILAHELMHAWLRLKGFPGLRPEVEEGICQVMAHLWLESELPGLGRAPSTSTSTSKKCNNRKPEVEKRLGEFCMKQIEKNTSSAYGDGFRAGYAAVSKYGLRYTLDHIRCTGTFPVVKY